MNLVHTHDEGCGQVVAHGFCPNDQTRKSVDAFLMSILPRMISIAVKKYAANPNDRAPAVRVLLRNAIRLAVAHLGREQTMTLATETLQEPIR